ncbi:hypothetical protein [Aliiglaciecola sp. M165]|uniref:hypothetical protein n=1 Tax=Aliiglaciecola sp. M165 TaxID=2593649 RepID=UPI001181658A|nr:hypothetical protein [Aliiglaciecola sp. M165]TRY32524.1 hypothetical protein FM019_06720 [Aliiglaciecola sp. M165]
MSNDKSISRRALLKGSLALTAGLTASRALAEKTITPSQVEGPFYPINPQTDRNLDLTQIQGHEIKVSKHLIGANYRAPTFGQ